MKTFAFFCLAAMGACGAAFGEPAVGSEGPHWPWAMDLPEKIQKQVDAGRKKPAKNKAILAWAPKDAKRIRAMLLIVANSDSKHFGEHQAVRRVAAKHDMAVVYFRYSLQNHMEQVDEIFAHIAERTGIEEFRYAPWVTFGKSSMGKFPYYMAWKFPDRTIATISYHAETPTWPMAGFSKLDDQTIPHVSVNGELEWGGTWAVHVRPSLLNYRKQTNLLAHQAVAQAVGHGDYVDTHGSSGWGKKFPGKVSVIDVWDYLAVYLDKSLALRLPAGAFATDGPIQLKKIDRSKGLLIEKFAVEDIFQQPRMDLVRDEKGFVVNPPAKTSTNGFARIPPAEGYKPPEGVPVVDLTPGTSPTDWLVTKGLGGFAMQTDPMLDVEAFKALRPEPGQTIRIDDRTATFTRIDDKEVGRRGGKARGMAMQHGLQPKGKKITVVGYTVLDVKQAGAYKVIGYHSLAVRLQIVLNGRPVDHQQVVQLDKGLYPMLFVLRMRSVTWGHVEPALAEVDPEQIAEAKAVQAKKDRKAAAFAARFADGPRKPASYIHKYADVPADQRREMFWLADQELADAWIRLHTIAGN